MPANLKAYLIHPNTSVPRRDPLAYLKDSLKTAGWVALVVVILAIFVLS